MAETLGPFSDPHEHHGPDEAEIATPRVAGLNRGQVWVSDDFDTPLPESSG